MLAQYLLIKIKLQGKGRYRIQKYSEPARLLMDIVLAKNSQKKPLDPPVTPEITAPVITLPPEKPREKNEQPSERVVTEPAPGLKLTAYRHRADGDNITAYFLEADKNLYTLRPALDHGIIPGRERLSDIVAETGAAAAVNASYFAPNGELIGITKIDGQIAGTTYFKRSALGIMPDGTTVFGQLTYYGMVTLGNITLPVAGVDCERGENGLIIYNKQVLCYL